MISLQGNHPREATPQFRKVRSTEAAILMETAPQPAPMTVTEEKGRPAAVSQAVSAPLSRAAKGEAAFVVL